MAGLLRSCKFWLGVFGVVQTVVLHFVAIDPEIWAAIDALVIVLIGAIAYEDGQAKSSGGGVG